MTLEFVSVLSTDKLRLPGLLYKPNKPTKKAAVWLHGMGDNGVFYNTTRTNALGEGITKQDMAFLAFNNRGAHNRKSLNIVDEQLAPEERRYIGGTHYERISDCVFDIDGAAQYLQQNGYDELYLLGHSSGADKIIAYDNLAKSNPYKKYVLAGGGDDSGLFFTSLGEKKFWTAISYAKAAIENGEPLKIMPQYTGMYPFSAQSAFDILNPDGDYTVMPFYEHTTKRLGTKQLFQEYRAITKPMLIINGEQDEYQYTAGGADQALKILLSYTSPKALSQSDFQLIPNTDHGFHGAESELAEAIVGWLTK